MAKVQVFNSVTLDGYFTGEHGDLSWAHKNADDPEWTDYVSGNAQGGGALLMGRVTFEMMEAFWPTEQARKQMPAVAKGMTENHKYVFSRTRKTSEWANTTFLGGDPAAETARLKTGGGPDITVLGSGSIVALLAAAGLVDAYTFVVVPVAIGKGRTMFEGVRRAVELRLTGTRTFRNGRVVMNYEG